MTLLQLQYFQVLARVLHYTRAAEELHISQPSLSYSISELEKELGVKLFEKENRKISLTAYGEQFLPYVQRSLALLDEGAAVLEQMAGNLPQVAKLGYFHSISASLIPALVEGFYREEDNRSIRFQFTEGPWAESVIIMRQPLYLAVPSDHPLAARHSVTFDDFAREPQVMLDKPSSLRTQMDRIFAQRGAVPNVVFEVRECNAALQYVALKFGVSVLPQVPAMDTEKVSIIPISDQDKEFVRTVYLSWSRSRPMSPAAQRVRDYIVEHYSIPE